MSRNEIFAMVDELGLAVQNGKKLPFTDNVILNQNMALDLLSRIRSNYDPALERAQKIITNEEGILNDASVKAQKTMSAAQEQAQGMVNEANNYAQHTKASADLYAEDARRKADEQARALLADAHARAQHMVEDAQAQAEEMVSQTSVLARAEARAAEILENANQHAFDLQRQTHEDVTRMVAHVEEALGAQLGQLRQIRAGLDSVQTYPEETEP